MQLARDNQLRFSPQTCLGGRLAPIGAPLPEAVAKLRFFLAFRIKGEPDFEWLLKKALSERSLVSKLQAVAAGGGQATGEKRAPEVGISRLSPDGPQTLVQEVPEARGW